MWYFPQGGYKIRPYDTMRTWQSLLHRGRKVCAFRLPETQKSGCGGDTPRPHLNYRSTSWAFSPKSNAILHKNI
ncbi:hypothetical protein [Alysiella filiformis]|uniref:hypothetical protein n=1 Tax=Alysiella filiformis TaxID=194196 RepID=UPI0011774D01|nr:hypothetical protein [Alysiella filiformis]